MNVVKTIECVAACAEFIDESTVGACGEARTVLVCDNIAVRAGWSELCRIDNGGPEFADRDDPEWVDDSAEVIDLASAMLDRAGIAHDLLTYVDDADDYGFDILYVHTCDLHAARAAVNC